MPVGLTHDLARNSDLLSWLALEGYVWYFADADQNDTITGQTSFAATTPSLLIDVPTGYTLIPLMARLAQTGTVAGGAVDILMEFDNANRYSSGGTDESGGALNARLNGASLPASTVVRSGATASAGYGVRVDGVTLGQDVSPAEGANNEYLWVPQSGLDFLKGPASWCIYTYAATTGPTFYWTLKAAIVPSTLL